jgi:hypothetical protein
MVFVLVADHTNERCFLSTFTSPARNSFNKYPRSIHPTENRVGARLFQNAHGGIAPKPHIMCRNRYIAKMDGKVGDSLCDMGNLVNLSRICCARGDFLPASCVDFSILATLLIFTVRGKTVIFDVVRI